MLFLNPFSPYADFLGRKAFPNIGPHIEQLHTFLELVGHALSSVAELEIEVEFPSCKDVRPDFLGNSGCSVRDFIKKTESGGATVETLLAIISANCPNTHHLILVGNLQPADFQALGITLLHLTSLDATNVSCITSLVQALQSHVFPCLTHLKLLRQHGTHYHHEIFQLLSTHPHFSYLHVGQYILEHESSEWMSLPCRLRELHCIMLPQQLPDQMWLGNLEFLCLVRPVQYHVSLLAHLLHTAPSLRSITVANFINTPGVHLYLTQSSKPMLEDLHFLQERCHAGLLLSGVDVGCTGSYLTARLLRMDKLLPKLSSLPFVMSCVLVAAVDEEVSGYMNEAIRVFTNIEKLKLIGPWHDGDLMQAVGFTKLKRIDINTATNVTPEGMEQLMKCMPQVQRVG